LLRKVWLGQIHGLRDWWKVVLKTIRIIHLRHRGLILFPGCKKRRLRLSFVGICVRERHWQLAPIPSRLIILLIQLFKRPFLNTIEYIWTISIIHWSWTYNGHFRCYSINFWRLSYFLIITRWPFSIDFRGVIERSHLLSFNHSYSNGSKWIPLLW
jgi:hypothetical protein